MQLERLRELLSSLTGARVSPGLDPLLMDALLGVMERSGQRCIDATLDQLTSAGETSRLEAFLPAILTHETAFFRVRAHYEHLANDVIPSHMRRRGSRPFRIWSAAASTGAEAYSALLVSASRVCPPPALWPSLPPRALRKVTVLATDISADMVSQIRDATYPAEALAAVPAALATAGFGWARDGRTAQVVPVLRGAVQARQMNLVTDEMPLSEYFDAVFCANVMIHLTDQARRSVIENVTRALRPGGALYVGEAENVPREVTALERLSKGVYLKV